MLNSAADHTAVILPGAVAEGAYEARVDQRGLRSMLEGLVKPCLAMSTEDVELRIIVTPLRGVRGAIGKMPATVYEEVLSFNGRDFDEPESLARVINATLAACAFPGVFAPVDLPGLGPCIDGGAVDNAPIAYGLRKAM